MGRLTSQLGLSTGYARWITQNRGAGFQSIGDLLTNSATKTPNTKVNVNDANATALDMQTFIEISDKITTVGGTKISGRVNINTAIDRPVRGRYGPR